MEDFLKNEEGDIKSLLLRFKKRNFKGDTGQAIKNSSFQFTQNVIAKVGSLVFTILLARIMMPELFGMYSLALSTIVLFNAFSDMGIASSLITYVSKNLGQNKEGKAKGYFKKLLKWKIVLLSVVSVILAASSYFIANYYYQKPIFLALLAGVIYMFTVGLLGILENSFKSSNNFKNPMIKEIIFQSMRFIIVPLFVLLVLKTGLSDSWTVGLTILIVSGCYLAGAIYLLVKSRKGVGFFWAKSERLDKKEEKDLKKFILPLTATTLSGVFFGYIDTIMLGHFVSSSYISYYSAAFNLVASVATIIGFAALSLFPIFSRLSGEKLEKIFVKARNSIFLIALFSGVVTYLVAGIAVRLTYGSAYLNAVPILRYFSVLIVILPLMGLYNNYFISRKRTGTIAKLLVATTVLNIVLNWVFITYGLRFSSLDAVLGACFATIISRFLYWGSLFIMRRRIR